MAADVSESKCIQICDGLTQSKKHCADIMYVYHKKHGVKKCLSYDVASWSEITPCNKIDKPLVVYRFCDARYDVHYNFA